MGFRYSKLMFAYSMSAVAASEMNTILTRSSIWCNKMSTISRMNYGCTGIKTFELRLESRHYRSLVSSTSIYESKLGLEASSTTDDTNITSAFSSVPSDDIGIGWRYFTPIEALVIRAKFI